MRNVSLLIPQGTYAVLMGGTGQGKTSLLEVICGLKPASCASLWLFFRPSFSAPANESASRLRSIVSAMRRGPFCASSAAGSLLLAGTYRPAT